MTLHGKIILTFGISIFTVSPILWILLEDWRWFVGGASIFLGTILVSAILSIETKPSSTSPSNGRIYPNPPQPPTIQLAQDDWKQPNTPPPDENIDEEEDPFLRPQPKNPQTPPI